MMSQLFLKAVASRLSAGGDCPFDRHCEHIGIDRCAASADILQKKKALIEAETIRKEPRKPCTSFMVMNPSKQWPCGGVVWTILLPPKPEGVRGDT